jgi:hypothetical protein
LPVEIAFFSPSPEHIKDVKLGEVYSLGSNLLGIKRHDIITLRIQALSLAESHDLLEDRRTELRHTTLYPIAFPYLYRSCTRDICNIFTFPNFQIKSKLFT